MERALAGGVNDPKNEPIAEAETPTVNAHAHVEDDDTPLSHVFRRTTSHAHEFPADNVNSNPNP